MFKLKNKTVNFLTIWKGYIKTFPFLHKRENNSISGIALLIQKLNKQNLVNC